MKSSTTEVWLYHLQSRFEAWWVMKLWRRKCVGFRKVMHLYLQVFNWKKDWKNSKDIYELLGSLKDIWSTSRNWAIFPVVILAELMFCYVEFREVKPALINSKFFGEWSSNGYVLPKLNTGWVFSDKIHYLLKLPTDQVSLMRVCKELLDDFRACSDWHYDEAGADFWQAFGVVCH